MLTYCLKCKKDTENVDSEVLKTKNDRTVFSSNCAVCSSQEVCKNKKQKDY